MESRSFTFLISVLAILWYIVTGDLMYEKSINILTIKASFLFIGFLILIYCILNALHNKDISNIIILTIFTLINLFYLFQPDSGKFFYSPLFLFVGLILGRNKTFVYRFFYYSMVILIVFTSIYFLQISFIIKNGYLPEIYIIENRIFDYFTYYNFYNKFSFSGLFGNSNSAGSVLFFLLYGVVERYPKKIFIIVLLSLLVLSGSITGILLGIFLLFYKFIKNISKRVRVLFYILGFVFSMFLLNYSIILNPTGYYTRIELLLEFPVFLLSNPYTLIIPYNFIDSSYYAESTIIDLFLNFGMLPLYVLVNIIVKNQLFFLLIIMIATNSSFLPLNALIIGILISSKNFLIKQSGNVKQNSQVNSLVSIN